MNEDYTKLRDFALLPELWRENERRLAIWIAIKQ